MIDHRLEAGPLEGSLFARSSPPPLCPLSSSSSSNSNSSSADCSPPHGKASRELTFPSFPSFAASHQSATVTSPLFAPRLVSAASLSFQSSNPFVLPLSASPSSSSSSSSSHPLSSAYTGPPLSSHPSAAAVAHTASLSQCGSTSFFSSCLPRLYSDGSGVSCSSDTDCGLMDAPYMQSYTPSDFTMRLPSTNGDAPPSLTSHAMGPPPSAPPSALGLVSLSASRSISSTSASSSLSLLSPRPHSLLSGCEREDGTLSAAAHSDSSGGLSGALWHCSYGCGKVYRKSSGRSIRRHVVSCFKAHWPGGAQLNDSELSTLIALQQDRGLLVTGLRRWKMRQSRRPAHELTESEKWRCPWNCGKFYRSTSSRSIQRHATTCPNRAAERSVMSSSSDTKRVKRQRDEHEQQLDVEDEQSGAGLTDSEADDNDEAEDTTDSGGSVRSGNGRMRSGTVRSSHCHSHTGTSDVSSGNGRTGLRLDTQLVSSSLSPLLSPLSAPHRAIAQAGGVAASTASEDVDFLYPDSSTAAVAGSSSPSYEVLSVQKREVALQLQRLLRDIHRRHGTNHPVFQSPMMTQQLIDGLLNKDVDEAVDDMDSDQHHHAPHASTLHSLQASADGGNSSSSSSNSRSSRAGRGGRRRSWVVLAESASLRSPSSTSSMSSAPATPSLPNTALQWTCHCGSSFKITSSKSIQKHRASCDAHINSTIDHTSATQHRQHSTHEPRIKREKH